MHGKGTATRSNPVSEKKGMGHQQINRGHTSTHAGDVILTESTLPHTETVLSVLERAATDMSFRAQLSENAGQALSSYDLNMEEKAAISCGDIGRIERWTGKLTPQQSKWLWARLEQERW